MTAAIRWRTTELPRRPTRSRLNLQIIATRGEAYRNEIPVKRYGHPAEVASVIRFLCSSDSSYVNGQTITVDGGITNA